MNKLRHLICNINYALYPYRKKRSMIAFLQHDTNGALVGCEVGVKLGVNLHSILYHLDVARLYALDIDFSVCSVRDKRIIFLEGDSLNRVDAIPDGFLDFCYLDGNHSYEHLKCEIESFYPKIKQGGLLGGHDFDVPHVGVVKAVLEFVDKNGFVLMGGRTDWWIKIKKKYNFECKGCGESSEFNIDGYCDSCGYPLTNKLKE